MRLPQCRIPLRYRRPQLVVRRVGETADVMEIIGRAAGVPVLFLPGRERAAPRCAFLLDVGVGRRKVSLKIAGCWWSFAGRGLRELSARRAVSARTGSDPL